MTREDERPEVVRKLVVVFDTCSSTSILEDLKRTDNLAAWRNLLIGMKEWLREIGDELGMELYKFVGDGWILLFPDRIAKDKLCKFLQKFSKWFDTEFHRQISGLLEPQPAPIGLTFGIDSGELIRLEMNELVEYIGRAINMATRLQGQSKEVPGGPAYKALFSKSWFNSAPRPPATIKVDSAKVSLRNIVSGDNYECLVFKTYEPARVQAQQHQHGKHSLEIVFEGDTKPYLEEQSTKILTGRKLMDRRYRIGIKNTTRVVVPVRVVLENCEPNQPEGVHLEHPLQVMGHPNGTSEVALQPGDNPSAFVDVVFDEILEGIPYGNAFGLCYAAHVTLFAIPRGSYVLTLRVEGNGLQNRKQFRIYQEPKTQLLTMRLVD
jgi:class 3 adenylate cyclase